MMPTLSRVRRFSRSNEACIAGVILIGPNLIGNSSPLPTSGGLPLAVGALLGADGAPLADAASPPPLRPAAVIPATYNALPGTHRSAHPPAAIRHPQSTAVGSRAVPGEAY